MIARDVMTRQVVTVRPDMPVAALAALLSERGISGAPVTDAAGTLLGLVTESDLMRRLAAARDEKPGFLARMFSDLGSQAARYARAHGRYVRDVMTKSVTTITPGTSVEAAAALMEKHNIRRLPVVEEGVLLGVVSRADLVKALLAESPPDTAATDAAIREELNRRLREQPWVDRNYIYPQVHGGEVTISGFAHSPEVGQALRVLAEDVPGVRNVILDIAPPPPFLMVAS